MAAYDKTKALRRPKRKRPDPAEGFPEDRNSGVGQWFVLLMALVGLACLVVGFVRHGFDLGNILAAVGSMITGIAFVAIGLLELDWLERIIGFADGLFTGVMWWFWTNQNGSLSESALFGRRGATVFWVGIGFPMFVWGCVVALRIF